MTHSHALTPAMLALLNAQTERHEFEQDMRLQEAVRRLQRRRSNRLRVPLYAGGFGLITQVEVRSRPYTGCLTNNLVQATVSGVYRSAVSDNGETNGALGFGS